MTATHTPYAEAVKQTPLAKETKADAQATLPREDRADIVARYNREHAVVLIGGSVAVLREGTDANGRPEMRLLTVDSFRQWTASDLYWTDRGTPLPASKIWLESGERRQYEGIVFMPGKQAASGYYNLWRGFSVTPSAEGSCQRFLTHLAENVCSGDEALYAWVLGWFAQLVQRPAEKLGTALVLRGQQGTGKTIVGEIVGSLLGAHYQLVSDPRYVSGRFNSHLASCLLLQLDEGVWGGDHVAAGKLKDLITGRDQLIEYKGKEPVRVDSYTRLFVTSNSDWVIPAGLDERRFAVLDISDTHRQDGPYFAAIRREMRSGGREALLHHLMTMDLSDIPLREIPRTEALRDQQISSMTAEQSWWMDILMDGMLPGDKTGIGETKCDELYEDYLKHANARGISRLGAKIALGRFLKRACKTNPPVRRWQTVEVQPEQRGVKKPYMYTFPSLPECRRAFATMMPGEIRWQDQTTDAPDPNVPAAWSPG